MKYHLMNKNLLIGKFELAERYGNKIATGVELYKITPFELGNVHKWLEHRQAAKHRQHIKVYPSHALYFCKRHSLGEARR